MDLTTLTSQLQPECLVLGGTEMDNLISSEKINLGDLELELPDCRSRGVLRESSQKINGNYIGYILHGYR